MVWSFQLTPWVLPALLALLLVMREWAFLWPRRREPGTVALLALAGTSGSWAALQLLAMAVPDLEAKLVLFEGQIIMAAMVPVAWVVFCLMIAGREPRLRSAPALLLYLISAVTVVLAFQLQDPNLLVQEARLRVTDAGYQGLTVVPGPWYWIHIATRALAVGIGGAVVVGHLLRMPATRAWAALPGLAALGVLVAATMHMSGGELEPWRDPSAAAFALGVTLLGWGILRHRLLDLGPVARTLVMVELRDPLVVLDGRGRIVDLNRTAERVLGLEVYGDVPVALGTLWASARERADRYARVTLPVEPDATREDGGPDRRTFEVTLTPLGRKDRTGGQTALLLRDVTERDRMEEELRETSRALRTANEDLERLANTDSLTELANRRHFMDALEGEMDRSQRYDRPLSLILLDLDHFKRVNDSHGHAAGDAVLKATAEVMRSVCRDVDLPSRLGGEELAILLPETRAPGARTLAERLRERLAGWVHATDEGRTFHVTASVGVATLEGREYETADGFLQRADAALYRAKNEGRNRVSVDRTREGARGGPGGAEPADRPGRGP